MRAFVAMILAALAGFGGAPAVSVLDGIAGNTPGCAIGVLHGDTVAYEEARGLADLDYTIPLTPHSEFYLASDSKQFTAFAIALLADRGALRLDDRVTKWIPELPARVYGDVTLDELVHHTAGVRDYWGLLDLQGIPATSPITQSQFLELIARQQALNFKPGDRFAYSNSGYALLAIVIDRASHKTLPDFAEDEIFRPLGMAHTSYGADHLLPLQDRAVGYEFEDGVFRIDPSQIEPLGDGGVRTTVDDLMRWLANLARNRLGVHPAGVAQLVESPGTSRRGSVAYGFGLGIGSRNGYAMFDHIGSYGGYESFIAWIPKAQLGVATLCNAADAGFSAWSVGLNAVDRYLGTSPAPSPTPSPNASAVELTPQQLATLPGTYTEPDGTVWTISANAGAIVAKVQGISFTLQPTDTSHLVATGAPQPIRIGIEGSGLTLQVGSGPTEPLRRFKPPALTRRELDEYAGVYRSGELKMTLHVFADGGNLYVDRDLAQPQRLGPVGRDAFTIGPRNMHFVRSAAGAVTGMVLSADGVDELTVAKTASP